MTVHWSDRPRRHHCHLIDVEVVKSIDGLDRAMVCPLDALPECLAGRDIRGMAPVLPLCAAARFLLAAVGYRAWN
jgi:hypothetical protein